MTSDDCNVKSIIRGKKEERKVLEIEKKDNYLHEIDTFIILVYPLFNKILYLFLLLLRLLYILINVKERRGEERERESERMKKRKGFRFLVLFFLASNSNINLVAIEVISHYRQRREKEKRFFSYTTRICADVLHLKNESI